MIQQRSSSTVPAFSTGGHCEQFWHGHGCPLCGAGVTLSRYDQHVFMAALLLFFVLFVVVFLLPILIFFIGYL